MKTIENLYTNKNIQSNISNINECISEEKNRPLKIGMFDSGVGGLTVLKEFLKYFPNCEYIYFGDSKRAPYGECSPSEIQKMAGEIAEFLIAKDVDALIIACNTITAHCETLLREKYPNLPILGPIEIGADAAANEALLTSSEEKNIGVLATKSIINAKTYRNAIYSIDPSIKVEGLSCPTFVEMAEHGIFGTDESFEKVKAALAPWKNYHPDAVILGCTHYPILMPEIQNILGYEVPLINPATYMCKLLPALSNRLFKTSKGNKIDKVNCTLYTTGDPEYMKKIAELMLPDNIYIIKQTVL